MTKATPGVLLRKARTQASQLFLFWGLGLLLGGLWVVISRVISIVTRLKTLLITTHEPPSRVQGVRFHRRAGFGGCMVFVGL